MRINFLKILIDLRTSIQVYSIKLKGNLILRASSKVKNFSEFEK